MKQLIFIHGGMIHKTTDDLCEALKTWDYDPFHDKVKRKDFLKRDLASKYEIIQPSMPNKYMSCYKARKIRFEKIFPYLNDEPLTAVGHSLGGMFWLKYLSEN